MDLELTEDERSVRDAFANFFLRECSTSRVRDAEKFGFDADLWAAAVQLGIPSMGVPEELGGGSASLVDLVLVCMEAGRRVAPIPVVESTVAARLLAQVGADAGVIEEIVAGTVLPTIALRPVRGGVARLAPAGAVADLLVALVEDRLVAVRRTGDRPTYEPPPNLAAAPLRDWAVDGSDGTVTTLAEGEAALAAYELARAEWKALTAAALAGVQAEALRIGLDYVKQRQVFGAPLGRFQAVQHRLADLEVQRVGAELLVLEAAWAGAEEPARFGWLADAAFLFTSRLAFTTARESLQFHGGYGYTLEYDIQLYFRRAKAWPLALGPVGETARHLAAELFAGAGQEG